jgi:predicted NBD/HSP70 family sugar kinase
MPVPGPDGRMHRLMTVASLSTLADAMDAAGGASDQLWERPGPWEISEPVLARWIAQAAEGLASATLSAATLVEIDTVMIDGWLPAGVRARLVAETRTHFESLDLSGVTPPAIRAGTVGPTARELGGAAIPLAQRFLVDQTAMLKTG